MLLDFIFPGAGKTTLFSRVCGSEPGEEDWEEANSILQLSTYVHVGVCRVHNLFAQGEKPFLRAERVCVFGVMDNWLIDATISQDFLGQYFSSFLKVFLGECSQLLSPSSSQKKTLLEGAIKGEGVEGVSHKKKPT